MSAALFDILPAKLDRFHLPDEDLVAPLIHHMLAFSYLFYRPELPFCHRESKSFIWSSLGRTSYSLS